MDPMIFFGGRRRSYGQVSRDPVRESNVNSLHFKWSGNNSGAKVNLEDDVRSCMNQTPSAAL